MMSFKIKLAGGAFFMVLTSLVVQSIVEKIETINAPSAIGPYSQAVRVSNSKLLYISGQLPVNIKTGEVVSDIKGATAQVMEHLHAILQQAGMDFTNVIKATIFLADMKDFASMNEVYSSYFKDVAVLPARETVQVVALPKNAIVEISMIAAKE